MAGVLLTELPASRAWVWLLRALCFIALLGLAAWWMAPAPAVSAELRLAWTALAVAGCVLPWARFFAPPCRLRCDSAGVALAAPGADWQAGNLTVAVDLGPCMLLRFDPAGSVHGRGRSWLAVDRWAVGLGWHALRCAVYSAPPHPVTDPPAERRTPPRTP